jgi:hypothetical protein
MYYTIGFWISAYSRPRGQLILLAKGSFQLTLQHLDREIILVIFEIKEPSWKWRSHRFIRFVVVCLYISLGRMVRWSKGTYG